MYISSSQVWTIYREARQGRGGRMLGIQGKSVWLRASQVGEVEYKVRENKRSLKREWNTIMEKETIKITKQMLKWAKWNF